MALGEHLGLLYFAIGHFLLQIAVNQIIFESIHMYHAVKHQHHHAQKK